MDSGNRNRNRNRKHKHKRIRNKSLKKASSSTAANNKERRRRRKILAIKRQNTCDGRPMRFSRPFEIGFYSSGSPPDRIPYHLYLLVKEAVDLIKSGLDLTRVEKQISFFCDFFYSHLPLGWKYDRDNAASLIAGYDTFLANGGPKYDISGYAPLGEPVYNKFDYETRLSVSQVFEIMSIIHSRKTPTPETFMQSMCEFCILFYCKICSCFGIDYQHLESASEEDVLLMNMGTIAMCSFPNRSSSSSSSSSANKISLSKDNSMFKHMKKLSTSNEPFELSSKEIFEIISIIRSRRLPPQTTFTQWNEYQISFYCKMCSCFGRD